VGAACGRCPGGRVSAFFIESGMSVAGVILPPPGYLTECYALVRAAGGVCVADEVQTGFGRFGSHFWGFQQQGVVPDIVTMGKPFGNGMPLAAVVCTRAVAASFSNGLEYFNTFGGNPVCAAAGNAVLDVIEAEGLQAHAQAVGEYLIGGLRALAEEHPLIGDVRGR
jgi:4-aminobutyrate aminotransferase-like enzyme